MHNENPIDPLWSSHSLLLVGDGRELELTALLAAGFAALCPDADPAIGEEVAVEYVQNQKIDQRNADFWGRYFTHVSLWVDELRDEKNKQMTSHMVARRLEQIRRACMEQGVGDGRS